MKPIQIDLRIHKKEKKNFLNERKIKQFIQNSCYLFVYLDKSYLLEHLSHQIERMTIKTKLIVEGEDLNDLFNLDQILQDKPIYQTLFQKCSTEFDRLKYLNFTLSFHNQQLSFICQDFISFSSKIIKLNVEVDSFDDCLYIFDYQFDEMIKFSITICGSDAEPNFFHQRVS